MLHWVCHCHQRHACRHPLVPCPKTCHTQHSTDSRSSSGPHLGFLSSLDSLGSPHSLRHPSPPSTGARTGASWWVTNWPFAQEVSHGSDKLSSPCLSASGLEMDSNLRHRSTWYTLPSHRMWCSGKGRAISGDLLSLRTQWPAAPSLCSLHYRHCSGQARAPSAVWGSTDRSWDTSWLSRS
jgi:hypothetical protein